MENGPASPDMGAMARRRVLPPVATRRPRWVLKPRAQCRLNNLGSGLRSRYARAGRLEDLEEAIRMYQEAVQRTPPDSSDLPSLLNNLGNGLSSRYARTGRLEHLARISHHI
jgi:hypothetical protein